MRMAISMTLIAVFITGCATTPRVVDRESKLLALAAGEAQQIPDSDARLTRQLQFANQQIQRGKPNESRQSLAFAAQTLRDAKSGDLKPQIRIAGWISISELSRNINDLSTARAACNQALEVLNSLDPIPQRPRFVVGVAKEVEALEGKQAAAKLLESSVDWIKQLDDIKRREALVDVCRAIFNDDEYDGGLSVLRTDGDAAWRTDTLAMLAQSFKPVSFTQSAGPSFIDPSELAPGSNYQQSFSTPVDFRSVFSSVK